MLGWLGGGKCTPPFPHGCYDLTKGHRRRDQPGLGGGTPSESLATSSNVLEGLVFTSPLSGDGLLGSAGDGPLGSAVVAGAGFVAFVVGALVGLCKAGTPAWLAAWAAVPALARSLPGAWSSPGDCPGPATCVALGLFCEPSGCTRGFASCGCCGGVAAWLFSGA